MRKDVDYRSLIEIKECAKCGDLGLSKTLHVHHMDGNHKNNDPSNLLVLCGLCHKRLHYRKWKLSDIGLNDIELLIPAQIPPLTFRFTEDEYIDYIKKGAKALKLVYGTR